jgi:hypothetical protein
MTGISCFTHLHENIPPLCCRHFRAEGLGSIDHQDEGVKNDDAAAEKIFTWGDELGTNVKAS